MSSHQLDPLAQCVATAEWWLENTIRHTSLSTRDGGNADSVCNGTSLGSIAGCLSEPKCVGMLTTPSKNSPKLQPSWLKSSVFRVQSLKSGFYSRMRGCVHHCCCGVFMLVCTRAESILCHLKDTHQEAAGQSRVSLSLIFSWEWVQIRENLEESCEFTGEVSCDSNKNHVSISEQISSLHSEQQWWRKWGKCIPVNWPQRPSYTSRSCGWLRCAAWASNTQSWLLPPTVCDVMLASNRSETEVNFGTDA